MAEVLTRWERVRRSIGYATHNLEAAERADLNGIPSQLRERDVERELEAALAELRRTRGQS